MDTSHKDLEIAGLQFTMEMVALFTHQLPDVKEFALIADSIELILMTIPERFTFVTGPINTSYQRIVKNVQKKMYPHNDELLGYLEFIHHTFMLYRLSYKFSEAFVNVELARKMELKYETVIHDSLQMLKTPRN
ncbi:P-loop containing nucleoside triphosphate hydrolase protein [Gigaspora margarita]|uniref:P-loop containing nucleoside triphosphate hydrolase protein n=1 Tax=Gigaspora margarita TaxID=4874 RepID=A0A8H3X611_GIGMA|nr:P-loop containing nucleoside triphosphate hydrolase protein [Gigaspora margarita]